jgi:hypothetical protein
MSYLVNWAITDFFERAVGKWQSHNDEFVEGEIVTKTPHLGLHVGLSMMTSEDHEVGNQYHTCHVFIYAPCNYVYVASQDRRIDDKGEAHTKPMDILSYHDSCWRDAMRTLLFEVRNDVTGWQSFKVLGNMDVVEISKEQREYLHTLENFRRNNHKEYAEGARPSDENPFHMGEDLYEYWQPRCKEVKYSIE